MRLYRWTLTVLYLVATLTLSPTSATGQDSTTCEAPRLCLASEDVREAVRQTCNGALEKRDLYRAEAVKQRRAADVCEGRLIAALDVPPPVVLRPRWIPLLLGMSSGALSVGAGWCAAGRDCPLSTAGVMVGAAVVSAVLGWLL